MVSSLLSTVFSTRHCPTCRDERPMEQPPCADHAECPEWICMECGTAILVGWLEVDAPAAPSRSARSISSAA